MRIARLLTRKGAATRPSGSRTATLAALVSAALLGSGILAWQVREGGEEAGSLAALAEAPPVLSALELASPRPATVVATPPPTFAARPVPSRPSGEPLPPAQPPEIATRSARLADVRQRRDPRPVRLRIPAIGVDGAVGPAGVEPGTRELEVPDDPAEIAWYRFGPSPGERGSAVLAGHVDLGGRRGVFFLLGRLEPEDLIVVEFRDGSRRAFEVVARRVYPKAELPPLVFRSGGRPTLTLVTCGGGYDASTREYLANVVVFALPVAPL